VKENAEYDAHRFHRRPVAWPIRHRSSPRRDRLRVPLLQGQWQAWLWSAQQCAAAPNRSGKENDKQLSVFETPTHNEDIADWQHCEAVIKTPSRRPRNILELRVRAICTKPVELLGLDRQHQPRASSPATPLKRKLPEKWQPRTLPPATTRSVATGDLELLAPARALWQPHSAHDETPRDQHARASEQGAQSLRYGQSITGAGSLARDPGRTPSSLSECRSRKR